MKFEVKLLSQQDQIDFVKTVSNYDIDVTLHKGSKYVDAKSVMGVATIDTTSDCYVEVSTRDMSVVDNLKKALEKYLVS